MPIEEKILKIVNDYLSTNNKPSVTPTEPLYSSGLLDSIEMFELVIIVERSKVGLKTSTGPNMKLPLDKIDTVKKISELCY